MTVVPPELEPMLEPIESLKQYGRNPRRGDVAAIKESLVAHGQYKPIIGRRETREVLVGNHTLQAAAALGWEEVAVLWRDVPDDGEAAKIVLADNRTSDLGGYDNEVLAAVLRDVPDLAGTGYDQLALDGILAGLADAGGGELSPPVQFQRVDPDDMDTDFECPQCHYEWSGQPKPS